MSEQHDQTDPTQATPPIGDDAEQGQTETPAPPDDVGVPSDEELAEEGAAEGERGD